MAKILTKIKLSEHKYKTPEGYLICQDAVLARTGKQEYLKSEVYPNFMGEDTPIMVDRKPEQVFAAETLASFEDKPITVEHPDESVTPENYSELAVGHTRNIRKGKYNGQDVMVGDLVITDADAISRIENGEMTELSCGYDCDITEGDNPEQINIRGNHVALCEQGRAGIAKIIDSKKIKDSYIKLDLGYDDQEKLFEDIHDDLSWYQTRYNLTFDLKDHSITIKGDKKDLKRLIDDYHLEAYEVEIMDNKLKDDNKIYLKITGSPEDVKKAYERLKELGYEEYLILDENTIYIDYPDPAKYMDMAKDLLFNQKLNVKCQYCNFRFVYKSEKPKTTDSYDIDAKFYDMETIEKSVNKYGLDIYYSGKDRIYTVEGDKQKVSDFVSTELAIKKNIKDEPKEGKFVVFKENGKFKGTNYENFKANVRNANEVIDLSAFNNMEQVVEYLLKYTNIKREDIIQVASSVEDSLNYRPSYYKKYKEIVEQKLNKLDKDDKVDDDNKTEYRQQKQRIRRRLQQTLEDPMLQDSEDELELKVRDWYKETYPNDDMGDDIYEDVTFQDIFDCLDNYNNVYECLGSYDSVIRNRVFEKLAKIIDSDYDYVYEQWLKCRG